MLAKTMPGVIAAAAGIALGGVVAFGQARLLGIASPVLVLALTALVAYMILRKTTIGRYLFAIGGIAGGSGSAG